MRPAVSFCPNRFATGFPDGLAYNGAAGRDDRDGDLSGQRVRAQRTDGLSFADSRGAAQRYRSPPGQIPAGGTVRRSLRGGGLSAGRRLSVGMAGEAVGWGADGTDRLRGRAKAAAPDAADGRNRLWNGRSGADSGLALRGSGSDGKRHFLHGCVAQGAADLSDSGLSGADGDLSGCGRAWRAGRIAAGTALHPGKMPGIYGAAGYGKQSAGPSGRPTGAGALRSCGQRAAAYSGEPGPCGTNGAAESPPAGAASKTAALSRGGRGTGIAAGGDGGVCGDRGRFDGLPSGRSIPNGTGQWL